MLDVEVIFEIFILNVLCSTRFTKKTGGKQYLIFNKYSVHHLSHLMKFHYYMDTIEYIMTSANT